MFFSSKKALKSSRMARLKKGKEQVYSRGLRKVLNFEGTEEMSPEHVTEERSMELEERQSSRRTRILTLDSMSEGSPIHEVYRSFVNAHVFSSLDTTVLFK